MKHHLETLFACGMGLGIGGAFGAYAMGQTMSGAMNDDMKAQVSGLTMLGAMWGIAATLIATSLGWAVYMSFAKQGKAKHAHKAAADEQNGQG